jgi:hypothetical protein
MIRGLIRWILPLVVLLPLAAAGDERLPDGLVTMGERDIAAAWLTGPSRIYGHGVLGDAIEATGLAVRMRDGPVLSFRLSGASVFEDHRARLADLDGDGRDEIIVVRSYLTRGAALAVFRVEGNRLEWVAETPLIGMAHRWLNPAGVADFDGDGQKEVALVVTPHIGGILKIYQLRQDRLVEEWRAPGFSNHAMGSRNLDLALVISGRDQPVLVLPNARRTGLRKVFFKNGAYRAVDLPLALDLPIATLTAKIVDTHGRVEVSYTFENGAAGSIRLEF